MCTKMQRQPLIRKLCAGPKAACMPKGSLSGYPKIALLGYRCLCQVATRYTWLYTRIRVLGFHLEYSIIFIQLHQIPPLDFGGNRLHMGSCTLGRSLQHCTHKWYTDYWLLITSNFSTWVWTIACTQTPVHFCLQHCTQVVHRIAEVCT